MSRLVDKLRLLNMAIVIHTERMRKVADRLHDFQTEQVSILKNMLSLFRK